MEKVEVGSILPAGFTGYCDELVWSVNRRQELWMADMSSAREFQRWSSSSHEMGSC